LSVPSPPGHAADQRPREHQRQPPGTAVSTLIPKIVAAGGVSVAGPVGGDPTRPGAGARLGVPGAGVTDGGGLGRQRAGRVFRRTRRALSRWGSLLRITALAKLKRAGTAPASLAKIRVATDPGVVRLDGAVDSERTKATATDLASSVEGGVRSSTT